MDREGKNRLFEFFAAEGKKFKSYVHRKMQSISDMDAEDIVGEVMLNMFIKADVSAGVENLASYVYRSLHNKIIDYQRRDSRTMSLQSFIDEDGEIPFMELLYDSSSSVSSKVENKEFMQRLAQAISKLEPKQRAVFIATEIKGKTFRELSEQWNEPMGTLLSRKCRAVKALQEMLKDLKGE